METPTDVVDLLKALVSEPETCLEGVDCIESIDSFQEAGLLTRDEGVVIQFTNGAEFQITIKQSRFAR